MTLIEFPSIQRGGHNISVNPEEVAGVHWDDTWQNTVITLKSGKTMATKSPMWEVTKKLADVP